MSNLGIEYNQVENAAGRWDELAGLMTDTERDLADASAAGLAPSVRAAATAFLTAWSGYAGESSDIATGFGEAMRARVTDYQGTDQASRNALTDLDGRLGPAR